MRPIHSLIAPIVAASLVLGGCSKNKASEPTKPAADNSTQTSQPPTQSTSQPSQTPAETTSQAPSQQAAPSAQSSTPQKLKPATPQREIAKAPPPPPPKPKPQPVVIPAGTVLTVRLAEPVGSKTSQQGERFQATVAQPITIGGKTVIPVGANASGQVTEAHPAGKFKGAATLGLALTHLHVAGSDYAIQSTAVQQTSKGKGKRTATMVGGGAGAGALIGGLAGGGKGAAIGALAGGAAGTAGAGLTGNSDISLPAESALSFKLTAPLTLKPQTGNAPGETQPQLSSREKPR
jgi:hypothetical protein